MTILVVGFNYFLLFSASTGDCELGPSWLLWLCVVFGVLFLVMLCVNVFLCSTMTCLFSRTEVDLVEDKHQVYTRYKTMIHIEVGLEVNMGVDSVWVILELDP